MNRMIRNAMAGAVALAGLSLASVDVQAMPVQPLSPTLSAAAGVEPVWCCRYGWRGGWGWRRPWGWGGYGYGGWGGYGYGWGRPYYGYGYGWRRRYGWRRW